MRNVIGNLLTSAQVLTLAALPWLRLKKKTVEASLLRSNEQLRLAMAAAKSVGWDWDIASDRNFLFGDIQSFWGIPSETYTASFEELLSYVHCEDRSRVEQALAEARQNRKPFSSEFRIDLKDRPPRWVAARGEFHYAADGKATRMLGLAVEITERKQIEEALRKSEEKYSKAFRESPLIVALTSLEDDRFIEVNETYERVIGWKRHELIGRTPLDAGIWVDTNQRAEVRRKLSDGGTVRDFEFRFRTRGGDVRTALLSAELIEINGEPCMIAMIVDITERKLADAALRESEERFRLVADTAPVTIWMTDVDNACVYVNRRWVEVTGRPVEAHLGNGWAENIHPEDVERCLETFTAACKRQQPFRMEYRLRRYDGEYIWIADSGVPRFNADGTFAGYIGSAADVTEIKAAEEVLSSMSQRLIEAHEKERAWIAGELHDDVGQRLALVELMLGGIKRALRVSQPALTEEIQQTRQQVQYLARDVQSLSHNLHPKPKYLGLAKASASFCEELSAQGVQIEFRSENIPTDLPEEVSLCLYRVLQESLQNAIKHSGSGRFVVLLIGASNEIRLSVEDSGIGFDPALAMRGRGIGLNSMKERLKLVNGSIVIDSQPNQGTTIRARVPLTPPLRALG